MDESLFRKHLKTLARRDEEKQKIISLLEKRLGITLEEEEFILQEKHLKLLTSSVKKNILLEKGLKDVLQEVGVTLS